METDDLEDPNPGPSKPIGKVLGIRRKRRRWMDTTNCPLSTPLHRLHQISRKISENPEMSESDDGESEDADVDVSDETELSNAGSSIDIDQKWRKREDLWSESELVDLKRTGYLIIGGQVWRPTNEDPNVLPKQDSDVPWPILLSSFMNVEPRPEPTLNQHIPTVQRYEQLASDSGQQDEEIIKTQFSKPRQKKILNLNKKKTTLKCNRKPTKRKRPSTATATLGGDISMDIIGIGDDWTAAADELKNIGRVNDSEKWTIEKLVDIRFRPGEREFLVKWEGWSSDYNSWEPETNFDSTEFVQSFLEERRKNKEMVINNWTC